MLCWRFQALYKIGSHLHSPNWSRNWSNCRNQIIPVWEIILTPRCRSVRSTGSGPTDTASKSSTWHHLHFWFRDGTAYFHELIIYKLKLSTTFKKYWVNERYVRDKDHIDYTWTVSWSRLSRLHFRRWNVFDDMCRMGHSSFSSSLVWRKLIQFDGCGKNDFYIFVTMLPWPLNSNSDP